MDNITKGFELSITKGFKQPEKIIAPFTDSGKYRVRILRPWELKALLQAIPKKSSKIQFEFLFYTGMRYVEAQAILDRMDLFDGENIHLTPNIIKKPKCKIKDRYVKLNPVGRKIAEDYFYQNKPLPHWNTWRENLERWSIKAKIDSSYMSVKTTRKTWESYLISIYPYWRDAIFISQGHTELIALKNYVNLPFSQQDKDEMRIYVAGWE
jgi:hypothetical protein